MDTVGCMLSRLSSFVVITSCLAVSLAAVDFLEVEEIYPSITRQKRSADAIGHPSTVVVDIARHRLNLKLNRNLLSPSFASHYEDEEGRKTSKGQLNCFYHGSVEGHPDWHVAMSTCQGLRGIFGDPSKRQNYFYIEPIGDGSQMSRAHSLYTGYSDQTPKSDVCGVCSKKKHLSSLPSLPPPPPLPLTFSHRRRRQASVRTVEWAIVNDLTQYEAYGRNLTAVVFRNLEIANLVDNLFRSLDIRVTVVFTLTWAQTNRIQFPSNNDLNTLLSRFSEYMATITREYDSAMLFTGMDLPGDTLGFAYVRSMCREQLSVGLVQDGGYRFLGILTVITAHELGHIFGMQHDDGRMCDCRDSSSRCIMRASANSPPSTQWSSCSLADLNNGYQQNSDTCLFNSPSSSVADPQCGNGIREGDEICDCGGEMECNDRCCNPLTCRLAAGAQCTGRECCSDDCQLLPLGTFCRNASNECDIAEYCSGDSARCPRDLYKQDTTPCQDGEKFCYAGSCPDRDQQCQLYFDSRSMPSCYSMANVRGSFSGNCGNSNSQYLPCEPEHAFCGQLQCGGGFLKRDMLDSLEYFATSFRDCRSFTLPLTADIISLGLVPEGTKCGNKSICQAQRCTPISSLTHIKPCPVNSNNLTCAAAGVCNNLNQCSCNVGLEGSVCERASDSKGGSSLSGGDIAGIFFGLLFGLALGAGVAALVIYIIYYRKNNKGGSHGKSTAAPSKAPPSKTPPKTTSSREPQKEHFSRPSPKQPVPSKATPTPASRLPPASRHPPSKAAPTPASRPPPPKVSPVKAPASRPPPPSSRQRPVKPPLPIRPANASANLPQWPPPGNATSSHYKPVSSVKTPGR